MDKPYFFKKTLHHYIVAMRIHPKMTTLFKCPIYAESTYPFFRTITSDSMYNTICAVTTPITISYIKIRRFNVCTLGKKENTYDFIIIINTDITGALFDIIMSEASHD